MFQLISHHTLEVLSESSFIEISIETMIDIFQLETLLINSDLELFNAMVRYVKANKIQVPENMTKAQKPLNEIIKEYIKRNVKNTFEDNKNMCSSTPSIRDVMKNIRFLSLSPEEFADGPAKSIFLTKDESFAIIMKISSPGSKIKIPEGFSQVRKRRYRP